MSDRPPKEKSALALRLLANVHRRIARQEVDLDAARLARELERIADEGERERSREPRR